MLRYCRYRHCAWQRSFGNNGKLERSSAHSDGLRRVSSLSGAYGRGEVFAGLRRYMLSIYNYMASGVLLSGIVALLFATTGMAAAVFGTPLRWLWRSRRWASSW
jgi:FtsH-binding integral membrane protein